VPIGTSQDQLAIPIETSFISDLILKGFRKHSRPFLENSRKARPAPKCEVGLLIEASRNALLDARHSGRNIVRFRHRHSVRHPRAALAKSKVVR